MIRYLVAVCATAILFAAVCGGREAAPAPVATASAGIEAVATSASEIQDIATMVAQAAAEAAGTPIPQAASPDLPGPVVKLSRAFRYGPVKLTILDRQ